MLAVCRTAAVSADQQLLTRRKRSAKQGLRAIQFFPQTFQLRVTREQEL